MNGVLTRVLAVYPLAIPAMMGLLAYMFPGYIAYDDTSQRVTISFSMAEIGAAVAGGYAVIGGVYAKFGIKR